MLNSGIELLIDPLVIKRLLIGFSYTLFIAFIAIVLSSFFGMIFGILRLSRSRAIRLLFRLHLEIVRVLPTLVLLFVLYFSLPSLLGIHINGIAVGIIAFTFWGSAEMSDIVRGSIISLPKHQTESGLAIGLSKIALYRYILIPQAIKRIVPPSLNLFARIIMTTSLLVLISVQEIVKVGKEIIEVSMYTQRHDDAAFWIYGFIMVLFFLLCYPLSKLSQLLANRKNNA